MAGNPISARKQFICDCGRGYIRKEHLQRHKATHAYPSFTCPDCYKFFTRLYVSTLVLKRHRSLRYDENLVPEMLDTGSRRSPCRKRNIDCTYQRPNFALRVMGVS